MSFIQPHSVQSGVTNPYTMLYHMNLPDPAARAQVLANQEYLKDKVPGTGTVWEAE